MVTVAELYLHRARRAAQERLETIIADLNQALALIEGKACVYATGSFGRLEASALSDLDLFIIVDTEVGEALDDPKRLLDGVDEIKLKCELIAAAERNHVAKFDADGRYLESHTIDSYTRWLGSREDDYRNTMTGRMLMLLESKPLIGRHTYDKTIGLVLAKYFRDYEGHEEDFVPSFLFNDILRMWRTFCVNYEFYRKDGDSRIK
jgi:predicted nucleotidyltransferase